MDFFHLFGQFQALGFNLDVSLYLLRVDLRADSLSVSALYALKSSNKSILECRSNLLLLPEADKVLN